VLRELVATLAIAAGLSVTGDAHAEDPLVFVGDPKMGVESTVRSTDSVARLFYRYEGVLPDAGIDESRFPGNVLGVLGRAVKLILVDEPLAELTSEISHEVGGPGGRARELGLDPTFLFYLPIVYRKVFAPSDEARAGAFTQFLTRNAVEGDRAMLGTLGGLEANYVHAWWINARIVRARGRVHHGDLLVYLASKLPYADAVYSVPPEGDGGNDIASYVTHLQDRFNRWRPDDRRAISRRLGAGYVWNLVDPTLFYAVYGTLVANVGQGRPVTKMPLPRIGDTTVLLSPRFALSPFGAEQTLDLFLGQGSGMLDLYGRVVSSGLADAYGVGARVLGIRAGDRTTLGAEIDLWRQPELLLDARGVFDRPQRLGLNAGAFFDVRVASIFGITGKIASKTPGWVVGQPASGGLHGYLGVSLALP
jgi:hypothetical protein